MGTDKAFLPWKGVRLVDRQLATLRALDPVELLVSGRRGIDYGVPTARVVFDAVPDQGPLAGIEAVLDATTASHVVVLAIDLPEMTPAFLRRLVDRCRFEIGAVARSGRGWEPLAAVYPRALLPRIRSLLADAHRALQPLIEESVTAGKLVPVQIRPMESGLFWNVNTPPEFGQQS